jgi:hypothetical protein
MIELTNEEKKVPPEQWPLLFFMDRNGLIDQARSLEDYQIRRRAWYEWVDHDGGLEYRQMNR